MSPACIPILSLTGAHHTDSGTPRLRVAITTPLAARAHSAFPEHRPDNRVIYEWLFCYYPTFHYRMQAAVVINRFVDYHAPGVARRQRDRLPAMTGFLRHIVRNNIPVHKYHGITCLHG